MNCNFIPFPTLSTNRLNLRGLRESDDEVIFDLRSRPEMNLYIERPRAKKIEDAQSHMEKIKVMQEKEQCITWAVCNKDSGQMIASICFWNFDHKRNKVEIGYETHPDFQGQGLTSEAIAACLDYAKDVMKVDRIEGATHPENKASVRILEKFDFKFIELIEEQKLALYRLTINPK